MMSIDRDWQKSIIERGEVYLGIEFGSTRIKAVLIDSLYIPKLPVVLRGRTNWKTVYGHMIWQR